MKYILEDIKIYDNIKKLATTHKISIRKLEEFLGFGNGTMNRWDTNYPTVEKIILVSKFFDVPMDKLVSATVVEKNPKIKKEKTVKDIIQDLALSKGLTFAELERKVGISNGSIGKWDKQSPSLPALIKIADFFGVSIDFLVGRTIE